MNIRIRTAALLCAAIMLISLCACAKERTVEPFVDVVSPAEPAEGERSDGMRFSGTVMLEGMEERVKLEHAISARAGISIDYDYELFERTSCDATESFRWKYDDMNAAPVNYLAITAAPAGTEEMAAIVEENLSQNYASVRREQCEAGRWAGCDVFYAEGLVPVEKGTDLLTVQYVLPAEDGCRLAELHYERECAEGVGARMESMLETLEIKKVNWEKR